MHFKMFIKKYRNIAGIYSIQNDINGKIYIGSSVNTGKRISGHFTQLKFGKHPNKLLQEDYDLYGSSIFIVKLLDSVDHHTNLRGREEYYKDLYSDSSYNIINNNNKLSKDLFKDRDTQRFWKYVDRSDQSECWLWNGPQKLGYGVFGLYYKTYQSHRVSYFLSNPEFDQSLIICHSCNNKLCVNPNHLYASSDQDNALDRNRHGSKRFKLNYELADRIRELRSKGYKNQYIIDLFEKEYSIKIGKGDIGNIVTNKIWATNNNFDISIYSPKVDFEIATFLRDNDKSNRPLRYFAKLLQERFNVKMSEENISLILHNQIWIDQNYILPKHRHWIDFKDEHTSFIRDLYLQKVTKKEIQSKFYDRFGTWIKMGQIVDIIQNKKCYDPSYSNFGRKDCRKLSMGQAEELRQLRSSKKMYYKDLCQYSQDNFGVKLGISTMKRIIDGECYND